MEMIFHLRSPPFHLLTASFGWVLNVDTSTIEFCPFAIYVLIKYTLRLRFSDYCIEIADPDWLWGIYVEPSTEWIINDT